MGATKKPTKTQKTAEPTTPDADGDPKKSGATRPDEMSAEVLEFIHAIDAYKRTHQRPFPNWSEVLEILKSLGYSRAR